MALLATYPSVAELMQPFLPRPYDPVVGCWHFLRDVLHAGGFVAADATVAQVAAQLQEVWMRGDMREVLEVSRPWDVWLMRRQGNWVEHVGIVADQERLAHKVSSAGPCLESLRRRRPFLVQVARLRQLL